MRVKRFRLRPLVAAAVAVVVLAPAAAAQVIETTVAAADGTELATDVYLPLGQGPWPVVLIRTPYGKQQMLPVCLAVTLEDIACVAQDTRGTGASAGVDTVFRDDAGDGRVTVEWVTAQPWCDGSIGMFGGSAFAITQYLAAPGAHSALRSIAPVVATPDLYHHAFLQGGALREVLAFNWLADQRALGFYDEVRAHRLKDGWWDPVEVLAHVGSVHVAGLHVGGWFDIFGQGTIDAFTAFKERGGSGAVGRQRLVVGPWTHNGAFENTAGALQYPANAGLDPLALMKAWYEATLGPEPSGLDGWPVARVYLMGPVGKPGRPGNRWLELDGWPPPSRPQLLYLAADGGLAAEPPVAGESELVADPIHPVPTLGGANLYPEIVIDDRYMGDGPQDQQPIEARDDVLVFSTDVLERPLTVAGRVRATIWLVPDTPDLDLCVRLTDVYPDGRSMLVLDGIQRARMRCGDQIECLLTPGEPVELTVDLWSTAMVFDAGHRIRLVVSGSNWPRFEVNPNNGLDLDLETTPQVARPRLLFGTDPASRLVLPVLAEPVRATSRIRPAP
jgi:predicted acyl esterase